MATETSHHLTQSTYSSFLLSQLTESQHHAIKQSTSTIFIFLNSCILEQLLGQTVQLFLNSSSCSDDLNGGSLPQVRGRTVLTQFQVLNTTFVSLK